MSDLKKDAEPFVTEDRELRTLLDHWRAPETPTSLDERVMTAFRTRAAIPPLPLWKRVFASSIRLPVPVAAACAVVLIVAAITAVRPGSVRIQQQERIVEVPVVVEKPVVTERVVTRVVYRNRQSSIRGAGKHGDAGAETSPLRAAVQSSYDSGVYFTHAKLAGFEAPRDLRIRIIKGGTENEK